MEHRVSNAQIEELLDYLSSHPNLAKSVGLRVRSKETIDREWNHLTNRLNAHAAGATKTSMRWKRVSPFVFIKLGKVDKIINAYS